MHGAFGDLADDFGDLLGMHAARGQRPCAIDVGLRHRSAGIGFEGQRIGHPLGAEITRQGLVIAFPRVRKAIEQPVHALKYRARSDKAFARQ